MITVYFRSGVGFYPAKCHFFRNRFKDWVGVRSWTFASFLVYVVPRPAAKKKSGTKVEKKRNKTEKTRSVLHVYEII